MNGTWSDVVDGDIVGSQLLADGAGHHTQASFGAAVRRVIGHGQVFVDRRDIDDTSSGLALDHLASCGLRAEKGSLQVNIEDTIPVLFGDIQKWAVNLHAGVVDHDIQPVEALNCRSEE